MKKDQELIREMVRLTREDNADVIAEMPNKSKTPGQRALQKKHGTPRAFATACVNAPASSVQRMVRRADSWLTRRQKRNPKVWLVRVRLLQPSRKKPRGRGKSG